MAQYYYMEKLTGTHKPQLGSYIGVKGYDANDDEYTIATVGSGSSGNYYNYNSSTGNFTFGIDSAQHSLAGSTTTVSIRFPAGKYILIPNVFNSAGDS